MSCIQIRQSMSNKLVDKRCYNVYMDVSGNLQIADQKGVDVFALVKLAVKQDWGDGGFNMASVEFKCVANLHKDKETMIIALRKAGNI